MLSLPKTLWCLRGRNPFASLQTGLTAFSGNAVACFPNSRPCGVRGAASRLRPCKPALRSFRARASHAPPTTSPVVFAVLQKPASLLTDPSVFSGTGSACLPERKPCGFCVTRLRPCQQALRTFQWRTSHASRAVGPADFAEQLRWYTYVWASEMRLGCKNTLSIQIGVWAANGQSAANWRLGCKLAFGLQLVFWLQNGVRICSRTGHSDFPTPHILCSPYNRLCGVCGAAIPLRPCKPALRSFRARASHASPTAGPAVFAGPQVDCVPANRPFGLFGHGYRMHPLQHAMRCLRCFNSFAPLLTGPSVFSGTGIACFPHSRPCGVCGDAIRLRPCLPALRSFRAQASHASARAGPAVFEGTQVPCVPANRAFSLFGHGHRMLPPKQALWCLRGRNLFASLLMH